MIKLAYISGPAIGAGLYSVGGFSLPYFVVGSMALIMAIVLVFVVPKVQTDIKAKQVKQSKSLTFAAILKARFYLVYKHTDSMLNFSRKKKFYVCYSFLSGNLVLFGLLDHHKFCLQTLKMCFFIYLT